MKKLVLFFLFGFQFILCFSQTTIIQFPQRLSIIPRNTFTNYGKIQFEGSNAADSIFLKKFKNGKSISNTYLKPNPIGSHHFYFVDSIKTGLDNYSYELWESNRKLLRSADSLCAGDIYIINGQSNAESASMGDSTNYLRNDFIRTYGKGSESAYPKNWFIASGDSTKDKDGHIGQLGIAIASYIINENKVPICIMNGAVGGKEIAYFLRDELNKTNLNTSYGRLLMRLKEINATEFVRAIIWYQGEKDAGLQTSYEVYKSKLNLLHTAWKEDYPKNENIYLFQIKHGCWQQKKYTGPIQKAQFDFALSDSTIHLISTNYIDHNKDSCHFDFENGYKKLGFYVYLLMNHYQYHAVRLTDIFSLHIKQIQKVNDYQINIVLDLKETIFIDEKSKYDFILSLSDESPINIFNHEDTLSLVFQNKIPNDYQLSYIGHSGNRYPSITNQYGQGLTSFYQVGESQYNWHLPAVISNVQEFPQLQYHEIDLGNWNSSIGQYVFKEGYYFYTINDELFVESSKNEVCKLTVEIYDALGQAYIQVKENIMLGKNRFKLPIERAKLYILNMEVRGKNSVASKKMKIIFN